MLKPSSMTADELIEAIVQNDAVLEEVFGDPTLTAGATGVNADDLTQIMEKRWPNYSSMPVQVGVTRAFIDGLMLGRRLG